LLLLIFYSILSKISKNYTHHFWWVCVGDGFAPSKYYSNNL